MSKNKIEQFLSEKFGEVRAVKINNVIWFVASDIAKVLDYRMASDMTRILEDDEKDTQTMRTLGGEQEFNIINESGLYSIVLSITKRNKERYELAREFKRWITGEVIPTIRETGAYIEENREEEVVDKYFSGFSDELKLAMFKELKKNNEELKVKAGNWDKFLDTNSTYTFTDVAKMISTKAKEDDGITIKISGQSLTKYLRSKNILSKNKSGKSYVNHPNKNYEDYFDVISRQVNDDFNKSQTRVKSNGVEFIYSILIEDEFNIKSNIN